MPSPKSGNPGTPVPPALPQSASEAATAQPGAVSAVQGNPLQAKAGQYDSSQVKPFKPPKTKAEKKQKKSWIEIVLEDEDKKPVPGEAYQITLPDGETVAEGTLDEKGFARLEYIDSGNCQVKFPNLQDDAWHKV